MSAGNVIARVFGVSRINHISLAVKQELQPVNCAPIASGPFSQFFLIIQNSPALPGKSRPLPRRSDAGPTRDLILIVIPSRAPDLNQNNPITITDIYHERIYRTRSVSQKKNDLTTSYRSKRPVPEDLSCETFKARFRKNRPTRCRN